MPRGVYARKSAQGKAATKKDKVKAKAKALPQVRSSAPAPQAPPSIHPRQAAAADSTAPEREYTRQDFRKPIDDMDVPLLKAYARSIGIMQRDVDGLTEDRLRQNCKARAMQIIEDA